MQELDPDDPRPPYQQVANVLRAAILTRTFKPGEKLPSGPELAKRYGVARMTVQQAVRVLRDEGLVVSRQGSGVYVRERTERPVGLRPHLERAFDEPKVTVDFAGFSGETLHGALAEPLDKVRAGRLRPESLTVRICSSPTPPCRGRCPPGSRTSPTARRSASAPLASWNVTRWRSSTTSPSSANSA